MGGLMLKFSLCIACVFAFAAQHCIAFNNYTYGQQFYDIVKKVQQHDYFKVDYREVKLPIMRNVILYRETDRGHSLLSPYMYKSIGQFLANQLPSTHATLMECMRCQVNKIIEYDKYIERKMRFNSTSEMLAVAQDLHADNILIWGLIPGESLIVYVRFVDALTGSVVWSNFIYS
jgi:hypothetical protein